MEYSGQQRQAQKTAIHLYFNHLEHYLNFEARKHMLNSIFFNLALTCVLQHVLKRDLYLYCG